MVLGLAGAHAHGVGQQITYSGRNVKLTELFQVIKKQTGFYVLSEKALLKKAHLVTVNAVNEPLESFVRAILDGQYLSFAIERNTIVLSPEPAVPPPPAPDIPLPDLVLLNLPITGRIVSSDGTPLEGATITIKGSATVGASDAKGHFYIDARPDQVLIFSHVGMQTMEMKVSDFNPKKDIVLKPKNLAIDDVVVTGYNNIRKESFTGAYTQVTKADLLKVTSTNLIGALQVFDPSFRIVPNNLMGSNPNVLPDFNIRGQSGFPSVKDLDKIQSSDVSQFSLTNNPNTPIFIMDGFEVSLEKVYDMDINRVKSITILKDAAATAMYGSRASNGVIVIETIQPKAGEFRVSYSGNLAITVPDLSSYHLMNAQQKYDAEMAAQVYIPLGVAPSDPNYKLEMIQNLWNMQLEKNAILQGINTYWLSQPLSTMINHKHDVYIEGGSDALRLGLELRYEDQNGVMKDSYRDRKGAGLTVQYNTKHLQVMNQATYDNINAQDSRYGDFADYSQLEPYFAIHNPDGSLVQAFPNYTGNQVLNPLYESTVGNFSTSGYNEWTNNLSANWYLSKYLFIKGQFAIDYKEASAQKFTSPTSTTYANIDLLQKGELNLSTTTNLDWNSNVFGSYNRIWGPHNINVSAGFNAQSTKDNYGISDYRGFPSPDYHTPGFAATIVTKPTFSDNKTRLFGSFATLNYSLRDIYLLDASFREDGSSEFGTDNKWAPFWSLGTGLNLHNTSLLKGYKAIDRLRVTADVGETGQANFAPFMARNTYQLMLDDWYPTGIGGNLIYMGNNDLTWEKQLSWNFGADVSILKRFTVNVNYYRKKTYDLITDVSLPSSAGFTTYKDNIGKVLNKGFEVITSLGVIDKKNFSLALIGNIAHNKNTIVEISQSLKEYNSRIDAYYNQYYNITDPLFTYTNVANNKQYSQPIMKYEEGASLTSIYGMKSLGINPANGQEVFVKRDGTITYDWDPSEQQVIGNTEPWAQGSFGFNARYKKLTLYTSFLYQWGGDQYNQTLVDNVENVNIDYYNADVRVLSERWQKPGDVTTLKSIADRYSVTRPTSRFVQRDNYVTFNSLSLSYDFDVRKLKRYKIDMLRLTFLTEDLARIATIQREMGLDYPYSKTFTLGLNATF